MTDVVVAPSSAAEVSRVLALLDDVASREGALAVRDWLAPLVPALEAARRPGPGQSRHPVVRAVDAARVTLGRAGVAVPVEQAVRLARESLVDAAYRLGVGQ